MADKPTGHRVISNGKPANGTTKMGLVKAPGSRPAHQPPARKYYGGQQQQPAEKGAG